MSKIRS